MCKDVSKVYALYSKKERKRNEIRGTREESETDRVDPWYRTESWKEQ